MRSYCGRTEVSFEYFISTNLHVVFVCIKKLSANNLKNFIQPIVLVLTKGLGVLFKKKCNEGKSRHVKSSYKFFIYLMTIVLHSPILNFTIIL